MVKRVIAQQWLRLRWHYISASHFKRNWQLEQEWTSLIKTNITRFIQKRTVGLLGKVATKVWKKSARQWFDSRQVMLTVWADSRIARKDM